MSERGDSPSMYAPKTLAGWAEIFHESIVLKQFKVCGNCGHKRNGERAPQEEIPWRCKYDGWINGCCDTTCAYRGNPNRPLHAGRYQCWQPKQAAALRTGTPFSAWDWVCNTCKENANIHYANHASRERCFKCGVKRVWLESKFEVRLRNSYPEWTLFDSDWVP